MAVNKINEKIKLLQMGNRTYQNALNSSSLLLARSLGTSSHSYHPKILCLTFDDQISGVAHVLFNQNSNMFCTFTVVPNEPLDELVAQIETVMDHYPIEIILLLNGDDFDSKQEKLADFTSALFKKVPSIALGMKKEDIHLILGFCKPLTGEVNLSAFPDLTPEAPEAEGISAESVLVTE